jgi:hypothetical protein
MQVHGPSEITDKVSIYLNDHGTPFAVLVIGHVTIYVYTPGEADQLIRAACAAKDMLLAAAAPDPATKHGEFTAASAAEVAQGVDVLDDDGDDRDDADIDARDAAEAAGPPDNSFRGREPCLAEAGASAYICLAAKGHSGDHMAYGPRESDGSYRAYHRWPHAAASRLAPPSGYGLKAIEVPADSAK